MITAVTSWWQQLSQRERWLVGIAAGLLILVGGWFLVVSPLANGLRAARAAHGDAIDRAAAVEARVGELRNLQARKASLPAQSSAPATLDLVLSQGAAEKGLTLSRNEAQTPDSAMIAIANARAPAVIGWLNELEGNGVLTAELSLRPNADNTVALTATMRRTP